MNWGRKEILFNSLLLFPITKHDTTDRYSMEDVNHMKVKNKNQQMV